MALKRGIMAYIKFLSVENIVLSYHFPIQRWIDIEELLVPGNEVSKEIAIIFKVAFLGSYLENIFVSPERARLQCLWCNIIENCYFGFKSKKQIIANVRNPSHDPSKNSEQPF